MANPGDSYPVRQMPTGARRCPICGRRSIPRYQPFCSGRCTDVDLGRWLKGAYRVETEEPAEEGSEADEP